MNDYIDAANAPNSSYTKIQCTFLPLPNCRTDFVRSSAEYFVSKWMASNLTEMMDVWQNWSTATEEQKQIFRLYLDEGLMRDDPNNPGTSILIDDPTPSTNGSTKPIGAFSETMLRWYCESFNPHQLKVEPIVPMPTGSGQIDFIEISGIANNYDSMTVKMWECKGSDKQVHPHHNKIHKQLTDYSRRLFCISNHMCEAYQGDDVLLKRFLREMSTLAKNKSSKVHYGVFIAYDCNIVQERPILQNLHNYPPNHPNDGTMCHNLVLLLIPNFKQLRLEVWQALHLV